MPLSLLRRVNAAALIMSAATLVAGAQTLGTPERYTATAVNESGRGTTPIQIAVDRWSTDKERDALVSTLLDQGADKLLAVLQDTPKVGFIRSSTGGLGWDLHYARKTMLPDGGEQVILANADILKARVRNLGRMPEKRFLFSLQVGYDTPPEKLDAIPALVEKLVRAQSNTRFVQCVLNSLGAYSIEFQTIYYIANRPDVPQSRVNDAIYRGILREFAALEVRLAYPTQRLMMDPARTAEPKPAPPER